MPRSPRRGRSFLIVLQEANGQANEGTRGLSEFGFDPLLSCIKSSTPLISFIRDTEGTDSHEGIRPLPLFHS